MSVKKINQNFNIANISDEEDLTDIPGGLDDGVYADYDPNAENKELAAIIKTVAAERSASAITREQVLAQAEHLDMSTQEFESFLTDVAKRGPRLN